MLVREEKCYVVVIPHTDGRLYRGTADARPRVMAWRAGHVVASHRQEKTAGRGGRAYNSRDGTRCYFTGGPPRGRRKQHHGMAEHVCCSIVLLVHLVLEGGADARLPVEHVPVEPGADKVLARPPGHNARLEAVGQSHELARGAVDMKSTRSYEPSIL